MKITLLNTSVLTAFGTFEFQPLSLAEARRPVSENEVESAIGHQSTAQILTRLLGVEVAAVYTISGEMFSNSAVKNVRFDKYEKKCVKKNKSVL